MVKSNPNEQVGPTSATFMHIWLKKNGFQMTKKIASLNGYDHQNQVKTWANMRIRREQRTKTNYGILLGDWTINIWSVRPIKWFLGWFWERKKVKKMITVIRVFLSFFQTSYGEDLKEIWRTSIVFLKYSNLHVLFWKWTRSFILSLKFSYHCQKWWNKLI